MEDFFLKQYGQTKKADLLKKWKYHLVCLSRKIDWQKYR